MQNRFPVIWSRHLRASSAVAAHNAIAAARMLAERQAESQQADSLRASGSA